MKRRLILISFLIFCSGLLCPKWGGAASGLRVTDVKPTAFSLVWLTGHAATCSANVYSDAQGNILIHPPITNESQNHPPAAQNGVMKVTVSGLTPGTTYYFQTVTTSDEGTLVEPSSGPLPSVRTELSSVVVDNDVLLHRILMSDRSTPARGALLLVEVEGGDYPITGWVGDYDPGPPWAQVNLMNIYSATNHRTLDLSGGEAITVESIGGLIGFRQMSATVPERMGGGSSQTLSPEPDNQQCTLDNAGPVIDSGQLLPAHGAVTNDSTPLISGEYSDELSDIDPRSARLEVDGLDVTDQAMVDSTGILYTPPVPLAEGIHTVELFVADEWGYEAVPVTWSFTIDSTAPTAALTYSVSTTEPTNQDVVATLLPSEWVRVTNNGELTTYTFTENGSFTFEFVDSAGNTGSATATVDNIDKVSPTGIVTYSTIAPTNRDVVATLVPSETVRVTNNGEQRTYTFTGNGSFTFEFVDPAGNTGSVTATVNNIDKAPPIADVSYSTTAPTVGAVVVNLEPSEPITVKNNGGALSYTFTENGTFTFEFVDQVGNPGFATATVQWIVKPPRGLRIDRR